MRQVGHDEGVEERDATGSPSSSSRSEEGVAPAGSYAWYVDGMNVIGARPDGWWRDRAGAVGRLSAELERFARCRGERVLVVFDGHAPPSRSRREGEASRPGGLLETRFAPGGPDAADKVLVAILADLAGPRDLVTLVSSDRALVSAGRAAGVATMGAASFLRTLATAFHNAP
jgi:predicted RNA-binding protein with PIN domain